MPKKKSGSTQTTPKPTTATESSSSAEEAEEADASPSSSPSPSPSPSAAAAASSSSPTSPEKTASSPSPKPSPKKNDENTPETKQPLTPETKTTATAATTTPKVGTTTTTPPMTNKSTASPAKNSNTPSGNQHSSSPAPVAATKLSPTSNTASSAATTTAASKSKPGGLLQGLLAFGVTLLLSAAALVLLVKVVHHPMVDQLMAHVSQYTSNIPMLAVMVFFAIVWITRFVALPFQAMESHKGYDNSNPRDQEGRLRGFAARAQHAHLNSMENFPAFAVAVVAAKVYLSADVYNHLIATLCVLFIVARLIYLPAYYLNIHLLRSLVFFFALFCNAFIFLTIVAESFKQPLVHVAPYLKI